MKKFGPTRGDLIFRLVFSLCGLGLLAAALILRGLPSGPAGVETIGIATLFFGGTLIWTAVRLIRKNYSDADEG